MQKVYLALIELQFNLGKFERPGSLRDGSDFFLPLTTTTAEPKREQSQYLGRYKSKVQVRSFVLRSIHSISRRFFHQAEHVRS